MHIFGNTPTLAFDTQKYIYVTAEGLEVHLLYGFAILEIHTASAIERYMYI